MSLTTPPKLFGTRRRTQVLLLLGLLEESYPSELAALLGTSIVTVHRIVDALEEEGVIATRRLGRTRRLELSRRYPGAAELRSLLQVLAAGDGEVVEIAARKRSRPRRKGKPS